MGFWKGKDGSERSSSLGPKRQLLQSGPSLSSMRLGSESPRCREFCEKDLGACYKLMSLRKKKKAHWRRFSEILLILIHIPRYVHPIVLELAFRGPVGINHLVLLLS